MTRLLSLIFVTFLTILPSFATAGSSEAGNSKLPHADVAAFANRVQKDLAARGANVAIVARMGRDPSVLPRGVRYTHVSFWVFSNIKRADGSTGRGYQVYNLYQLSNDKSQSNLVQDTPADFMAGAHRLDVGVIIPDARLQKKLLKVIASPTYSTLHNPRYSVLSNPNTSQFQNCTEHTLDVIMASIYGTRSKPQIKANIAAYFQPQEIQLGGMKRVLASASSKALTTQDHGPKVATATFGSISRFMSANKLASRIYRITPGQVVGF
ncbi:DUF2145 domain-containing protein [Arenibacterium sp. CAU 1754]